jgi:hypothetical protein
LAEGGNRPSRRRSLYLLAVLVETRALQRRRWARGSALAIAKPRAGDRQRGTQRATALATSAAARSRYGEERRWALAFRVVGDKQESRHRRQDAWFSSIREEIGGLALASVRSMRATASGCLLLCASQAIGKHLRDRGAGAGVPPELMPKRNSEQIGSRGLSADGAARRGAARDWGIRKRRPVSTSRPARKGEVTGGGCGDAGRGRRG